MLKSMEIEKKLLLHSVILAIAFAIIGVLIGLYAKSYMIIFDGLYSLISVMLSSLSLFAAKFMSKNDWKRFPFGKFIVEPLVIIVKYTTILFVLSVSLIAAVFSLLSGGSIVDADIAILYALFSSVACFAMYLHLMKKSKKYNSGLLIAESSQWLFDTYASLGVLITFTIVYVLNHLQLLTHFLSYIDPLIVIVLSISFAKQPINSIKDSLKEVLSMSPEDELSKKLSEIIMQIEKKYCLKESFLRVSQGRKLLWIEIDFVVDEQSLVHTIKEQDIVREEILQMMKPIKFDKWITVSFTSDRKWAI